MLVDLCCALKPSLNVVDGIVGMEGNGPTGGKPRFVGALAASRDPFVFGFGLRGVNPSIARSGPLFAGRGMARNVCPESVEELILLGTSLPSLSVPDFEQPESCSVNFWIGCQNFFVLWRKKLPRLCHASSRTIVLGVESVRRAVHSTPYEW